MTNIKGGIHFNDGPTGDFEKAFALNIYFLELPSAKFK